MFCPNCKNKAPSGAIFCPVCGYRLIAGEINMPNAYMAPKKSSVKFIRLFIGLFIAAITVLLVSVFFLTRPPKVTLANYVTIKTSGYNGTGKATATFNVDKFYKDYNGKIKFTAKGKRKILNTYAGLRQAYIGSSNDEKTAAMVFFIQNIPDSGGFDKASKLSNGDTLTYDWNLRDIHGFEQCFHIRLDATPYTCKVSGLKTKH